MSDGIYSALSGAIAQERNLSVVANNVANVGTTGYQGDKAVFGEIVAKNTAAVRQQPLHYAEVTELAIDRQSGGLEKTDNPLDVALQGEGYFAVQTPAGERYTRAGSFVTDGEGTLRTHGGLQVLGDGGAPHKPGVELTIPQGAKEIRISPDGTLTVDKQEIGKLKIVRFDDPNALSKEGITLLAANAGAKPVSADDTQAVQGYLENANVNAVAGMNELITVNRSFDALQKVIEAFKQIDERTARDVGGK